MQDNLSGLVLEMLKTFLFAAGPLLATTAVVAVAATFFQTKLLVSGEALKPKFSRINPLQGIKRLFSLRSVIEALKGILKITVLLFLIYQFLVGIVDTFTKYLHTDLAVACAHLVDEGFQMVMQIAIAFVVLAGRIVRKAEEHHIAIIENVPLARALYATAELNREIPPELYNAVAEVLVYLYRMDEKLK